MFVSRSKKEQELVQLLVCATLFPSPLPAFSRTSTMRHKKKKVKDYIGQLSNEHDPARMLVTNTLLPSSLVLLYPVTLFPQHVAKED